MRHDLGFSLQRSPFGYLEVAPKPSEDELRVYYRDRYFGNPDRACPYSYSYTNAELRHKMLTVDEIVHVVGREPRRVFEVGVGEGFTLHGLREHGWAVSGVDLTLDGLVVHHPDLADRVSIGDVFEAVDGLVESGERFDVVICNNVLEHVVEPVELMRSLTHLVAPGGWVRVMVPNDDSTVQRRVTSLGYAASDFWVAYPDHLTYFSPESLVRLLEATGWDVPELLADFPIDVFLLNPSTNYVSAPAVGRQCHFARVEFELAIADRGVEALVEFRRGCARGGVGRNLIAYGRPAPSP